MRITFSRAPTRPYRFDFENNEDEERAIAEAIAREEELMRQEEADKGGRPEPGARDRYYPQPAIPRYTSNLAVHRDDSPDTRAVKQEGDNKDEDQGESNLVKDEQDIVEESNAVADWQPSRRGPALPPTPKYKKKMYERSLEDSSSSGSEVRRRGRPPKRHQRDIEEVGKMIRKPLPTFIWGYNPILSS
ncbi:hypothetical protein TELCIR_20577 [Teladorsagia circumcincta]|uniref:Uncharacterized protein n=1 Tax=Teladorsagia circumcincta TaxID=45464 RepID=A0A2G9TJ42_TELCI|nr:hypothetical protein TELCIR_20577 [Teladorsagia circumcincta]